MGWEWGELKSRVREFFGLCTGRRPVRARRQPGRSLADPRPREHIEGIWEQLAVVVRAQINSSMLVGRPPACYCARDVEIQVQARHGTSIMLAHVHGIRYAPLRSLEVKQSPARVLAREWGSSPRQADWTLLSEFGWVKKTYLQ